MRARFTIGLWLAIWTAPSGCAVKSSVHLMQAEQAVLRADGRGAAEHAPYEYTLAQRYLEKAREAAQDAHHKEAEQLARASAGYADQAVISMQERGVGKDGTRVLPDTPPPTPAPEPAHDGGADDVPAPDPVEQPDPPGPVGAPPPEEAVPPPQDAPPAEGSDTQAPEVIIVPATPEPEPAPSGMPQPTTSPGGSG